MRSRCLAAGLLLGTVVGLVCNDTAFGVLTALAISLTLGEVVALLRHFS